MQAPVFERHRSEGKSFPKKDLPNLLVLSSSLLTDRMFLHTRFLDILSQEATTRVWATSAENPRFRKTWNATGAKVEGFPEIQPFREFPHNYLRRLNELTWDFRQLPPSRLS